MGVCRGYASTWYSEYIATQLLALKIGLRRIFPAARCRWSGIRFSAGKNTPDVCCIHAPDVSHSVTVSNSPTPINFRPARVGVVIRER